MAYLLARGMTYGQVDELKEKGALETSSGFLGFVGRLKTEPPDSAEAGHLAEGLNFSSIEGLERYVTTGEASLFVNASGSEKVARFIQVPSPAPKGPRKGNWGSHW